MNRTIAGIFTFIILITGCTHIPENPDKPVSYSLSPATEGVLADASKAVMKGQDEGESAFLLISENKEALKWRLALIDSATTSIDLQVFIWTDDECGRLIMDRVLQASRRGVKVRLLVDDMPKDISDKGTAMISRLDNVQMRRFNPGLSRKGLINRIYQMSTQFKQLNRRMHNKQLIVDGKWALVGGRNIGNPYFGLSKKYNNRDLDMLLTGEAVGDLALHFDIYWNADATYPGEAMAGEFSKKETDKAFSKLDELLEEDRKIFEQTTIPYLRKDWVDWFETLPGNMDFGVADCLQDSPEVKGDRGMRLVEQIEAVGIEYDEQSCIITPYMIPSEEQIENIKNSVSIGRRVRILVPSMESNNHTMAHSHYKKYRKQLLEAGAELYEFRGWPSDEIRSISDTDPVESKFISLHTKAFVLDDRWVLLGSLNVDPRSIHINTEHMLLIESPELAKKLLADFEQMISHENAWEVTFNEKGKLQYVSSEGVKTRQPARGFGQRCSDFFYRLMPIESQL